jgi:HEAT repeat protein
MKKTMAVVAALALAAAMAAAEDDPHQEAAKLIKKVTKEKEPRLRAIAVRELGRTKVPEAVPALAGALKDKEPKVRASAAEALRDMGEMAKEAEAPLRDALLDSDAMTVWYAASALKGLGMVTTDLMPAYRRLLAVPSCDMRVSAAVAIQEYAPLNDVLPVALACRKEPDPRVSGKAIRLAGTLTRKLDRKSIPVLIEGMPKAGAFAKDYAEILGGFKPPAVEAIPALTALLKDDDWENRKGAAMALGAMGKAAAAAAPALSAASTGDREIQVREEATRALAAVQAKN